MRKAALLALPLLALSPPAAQAAILELSFDATVTAVDDPESLHGYTALLGQQGQVSIQIDLDAMPAFATSDDGYWNMREAASVDSDWLKVSAQIGDRQLRTADLSGGAYDSISSVLDIIHMYAQETPAESFGGGVFRGIRDNRQACRLQSRRHTRAARGAAPDERLAPVHVHRLLGQRRLPEHPRRIRVRSATPAAASPANSRPSSFWPADNPVTARLLETLLPATAWLFGSALPGLARRLAQR